MVKIALQIKASLECIETLYTNHPHYQWFLKLKCGSCGEVSEKFHDLTESEKVAQKHSRSETNLLIKCKLCSRENSIDVLEGSNGKLRKHRLFYTFSNEYNFYYRVFRFIINVPL